MSAQKSMQRINPQQGRPSTNGYSCRRVDPVMGARTESKMQSRKSGSPNFGFANGVKTGRITSPSRDRLIYVLSCLVGRHVEVHVKNGSVISGIFHATNADRDFEIVLEMAQVVKDGSVREHKSPRDTVTMPQLMIVPARELVQVLAKDLSLGDELSSGLVSDKRKDFMIDSVISHSHHVEMERELARWIPDEDDPECPELDNTFARTLDRNWDQFRTNETLFGVKSTFNEELYTTKLERGPQMKELESFASRIAREIEGEDTQDFHQAEERGFSFHDDLGLDEESRYSAVRRDINDGRFSENKNSHMEAYNSENIAGSLGLVTSMSYSDSSNEKKNGKEMQASHNETLALSTSSSVDEETYPDINQDLGLSSIDQNSQPISDPIEQTSSSLDGETRLDENKNNDQGGKSEFMALQDSQACDVKKLSTELEVLSTTTPCDTSSTSQGNIITDSSDSQVIGKSAANESVGPSIRQGGSTEHSCTDPALNHPRLSPSSSCGSLSSEKSTLNPNAKEFKLNPNAKVFVPSSSMRQHAAVPDASYYYPSNVTSVPHMHGLPVGVGVGPSFSPQPVFYNPQAAPMQASQAYIHPGGPMYGQQQMMVGPPPQVYYVQGYQPEMPHRGRKF